MKRNLLLLIFLISLVRLQAQEAFSHWSAGLSVGPSFPTGHFGSKNIQDAKAGSAGVGIGAEITGGYAFNRSFGAALVINGQEDGLVAPPGQTSLVPVTAMPSIVVHNGHWKIARFLAGGVFNQPLSPRRGLSLGVRLLGGVLRTSIPGYSYSFLSGATGQLGGVSTGSGKIPGNVLPWTFCYQADAGLKWRLPHRIYLVADAGYAGATPELHYSYTIVVNGVQTGAGEVKRTVPVGVAHLRVGVELML
jgi:hypothetical protein